MRDAEAFELCRSVSEGHRPGPSVYTLSVVARERTGVDEVEIVQSREDAGLVAERRAGKQTRTS